LWEFPNIELTLPHSRNGTIGFSSNHNPNTTTALQNAARRAFHLKPNSLTPFCTIKHSITRYRIQLNVFRTRYALPKAAVIASTRWLTRPQLARLPFTAAHKKILIKLFSSSTPKLLNS
jgi:adenine-specific DNA glycosylase